jgi:AcrR family transcriptional regulator
VVFSEMAEKRKYELKKRAEKVDETRRKVVEAAVELHRTVGPAATQITEIARRAGVQRVTVYNHFPDEVSLLSACSAHWRSLHPSPDPSVWESISDPGGRLRRGLRELYAWYRETEPMTANVLRDAEVMPTLGRIIDNGLGRYLERVRQVLAKPLRGRGRRAQRVDAAVRAAVDFHTWRALSSLRDAEAAELGAGLIELAANI